MSVTLISVAVIGTFAAWLVLSLFKRKDRAEIISRLVRVETEVAEMRRKGDQ